MGAFIWWLIIGFAAGALAKMITPQQEKGGWISSIVIGLIGSLVGGFIFNSLGISTGNLVIQLIAAVGGAVLILFIYYKYLADKLNLPI
jgi:uncharacterized membrane protein YeaQ/YmgE (transglycosylase-associated protein family)